MDDMYDDNSTSDFIDGAVGGVILSEFLTENSDSTYKPGENADGTRADYTSAWKKFAPPTKGFAGVITLIVKIGFIITAVASIAMLVILGVADLFGISL